MRPCRRLWTPSSERKVDFSDRNLHEPIICGQVGGQEGAGAWA